MTQELVVLLVPYAALVAGCGMVAGCVVILLHWRRVSGWHRVPGELISTRLRKGVLRMKPAPLDLFIPEVEYRYRYAGQTYTGTRITVRDRRLASVDDQEAQAVIDGIGSQLMVYVDPTKPARAVLDIRLRWQHYDFLLTYSIIGLLLVAVGVALLVYK